MSASMTMPPCSAADMRCRIAVCQCGLSCSFAGRFPAFATLAEKQGDRYGDRRRVLGRGLAWREDLSREVIGALQQDDEPPCHYGLAEAKQPFFRGFLHKTAYYLAGLLAACRHEIR